jgi:hypothetical protein
MIREQKKMIARNATNSCNLYKKGCVGIMATSIFFGLMPVVSEVYAQEATSKLLQHIEPVAQDSADVYGKLLTDAEELIKQGKPADAYNLLEPYEFEHSGEERFDYLIGIAALDSGRADKATLAFERVLTVNPDSAAARLDMARAYYQLGDMPRAKTEFTIALKQNPSPLARANIEKYLGDIELRGDIKATRISGYVAGTIGHDSNVNNATDQTQIFVNQIPATIALDPNSVAASDNYYVAAAGGEITHVLNNRWGVYGGADVLQRGNHTQKGFDSQNLVARFGTTFRSDVNQMRIGLTDGRYSLGGLHNSDTAGLNAEWNHAYSPSNQLKVFGQYMQYRYIDVTMQTNDFDQQAIGLGWQHVVADGRTLFSGSLYYGNETDVSKIVTTSLPSGGRADGRKSFSGLRIGVQKTCDNGVAWFANAGEQIGDYNKINYYFQRQRSDRQYDLTVGANWRWNKLWTLRPQLNYSRNDSNIIIYGYEKRDYSLTIRRDFR